MEAATRLVSGSPRELPMSLVHAAKTLLNRRRLRPVLGPVVSRLARGKGNGVQRIFCDDGIWAPDVERLLCLSRALCSIEPGAARRVRPVGLLLGLSAAGGRPHRGCGSGCGGRSADVLASGGRLRPGDFDRGTSGDVPLFAEAGAIQSAGKCNGDPAGGERTVV